jgi:hypothetical protein
MFPPPLLTSQAKNQKIIATKPQNQKISKVFEIPMEYRIYYESTQRHPEIRKLIETNYTKHHNEFPSTDNKIACNSTVKNRLLCFIVFQKNESTFANRFAGNLVTFTGIAFTLHIIGNTLTLVGGIQKSANSMNLDQEQKNRVSIFTSAILGAGALSSWLAIKISDFGLSLKKNTQSQIIVYDIRDCNTDPQCRVYKPKNKSTKK